MNQVFLANFGSFLIMGIALLWAWQRHGGQSFVRDLGWSNIGAAMMPLGYMLYRQAPAPLDTLGFTLLLAGAVANLSFLANGAARLAGRPLGRRTQLLYIALLACVMVIPPFPHKLRYWSALVFVVNTGIGLALCALMWRTRSVARLAGPLLIMLGFNQLNSVFLGEAGVSTTVLVSIFLRLALGVVFFLAALDRSARALSASSDQFRMLTENSRQGIIVFDGASIAYANPAARAIFELGSGPGAMTGERLFAPVERASFEKFQRRLDEEKGAVFRWDGQRRKADGSTLHLLFSVWRIEWAGRPSTQMLVSDETARLDAARAALHKATHDELTGLPNRHLMMEYLKAVCAQQPPAPRALVTLNLNRFKLFNQSRGHAMGDRALQVIAEKLKQLGAGMADPFHLGGDEFALVLHDRQVEPAALASLRRLFMLPIVIAEDEIFIDASIGMAVFPDHAGTPEALLRAASAAMHQAKKIPGNAFVLAEKRFEQQSSQTFDQEQALRRGIRQNEFFLHFQPKVDPLGARLLGFEALARWDCPGVGPVSPVEFIAAAERTGLINELGTLILVAACRQIAQWQAAGVPCVPVAVNVSPMQLLNTAFIQTLEKTIRQFAIPPHLLTLEITESAAIADLEQTRQQLERLRALGIHVALDDFGSGFSSLSMLRGLPLQTLKIDRALITPLPAVDAFAIVKSICQLAAALDMRVVAEGVETADHARAAHAAGCHELQGYYFSRPLAPSDASRWLELITMPGASPDVR